MCKISEIALLEDKIENFCLGLVSFKERMGLPINHVEIGYSPELEG